MSLSATNATGEAAIQVSVNETNSLQSQNNVTGADDLLFGTLSPFPASLYLSPMYLGVFEGNYTISDLSSASPLEVLVQPTYTGLLGRVDYFVFQASSDNATAYVSELALNETWLPVSQSWTTPVSGTVTVKGLSPGVYTVAAGDEWGEILLLYFIVS
jgi:hypothetical protein